MASSNHPHLLLASALPLMMITVSAYAAGGAHPNPLDILNSRNRHTISTPNKRKHSPSRHYAPMDALRGHMVVKRRPSGTTTPFSAADRSTVPSQPSHPRQNTQPEVIELHVRPARPKAATNIPAEGREVVPAPGDTMLTSTLQSLSDAPVASETESPGKPVPAPKTMPAKHVEIIVTEANSEIPTGKRLEALLTTPPPAIARQSQKPFHIPKEKTLYMTFDDGPIGGTENLLRVLREENVEATMFCIGREVVKHPKLFQEELAMPNLLVANHTYTHANNHYRRFYNSPAVHVVADIDKAQAVIGGAKYLRLCGRNVWRLPAVKKDDWGISVAQRGHEIPKYNALWDQGYFIYGWDVEWLFSHRTQRPLFNGAEMARRVNARYQGAHTSKTGKVILLAHDFMFRSAYNTQQLRSFIQIMKGEGWRFKTIDDYSIDTPDAYVHSEKKTAPDKLRPAQKIAQQASVLVPVNQPEIVENPSTHTVDLSTQLSHAIRQQSFIDVRSLLARGVDINGRNTQGELPLNLAIQSNNAVLVRMLVERGARIFNLDANGMSPMGVARQQHSTVIVMYLQDQIKKQKLRRLQHPIFPSNESFAN